MCPGPGPGGEVRAARPGAGHRLRGGQQGRGGAGGGGQVGRAHTGHGHDKHSRAGHLFFLFTEGFPKLT